MRPTPTAAAALLLVTLPAAAGAATVTAYTNRAAYTAAVAAAGLNPGTLETFNEDRFLNQGVNLYHGLNYQVDVAFDGTPSFNVIGDGYGGTPKALNGVETGRNTPSDFRDGLQIFFPNRASALGGDFTLSYTDSQNNATGDFTPDGINDDDGIGITILGQEFNLENYLTNVEATGAATGVAYAGFFGVVADASFSSVDPHALAASDGTGFQGSYTLDNLAYSSGDASPSPVPEPLAAVGAAVGLGGVILRRRRAIA